MGPFNQCPIILGGDFNVRIGNLNSFEEELFEESPFSGLKNSMDKTTNPTGEVLEYLMEDQIYLLFLTSKRKVLWTLYGSML